MTSQGQQETARTLDRDEDFEKRTVETFDNSKILQVKRWEIQDGPFRGFGSPPGRF